MTTRLIPQRMRALAKLAGQDTGRYPLNGVRVTATAEHGYRLEVTDGHQAVRVDSTGFDPAEFPVVPGAEPSGGVDSDAATIPATAWQDGLTGKKRRGALPILDSAAVLLTAGEVVLVTTDLETPRVTRCAPVDGTWPDLNAVIPTTKTRATVGMNLALLGRVCTALGAIWGDRSALCRLDLFGPDRPIRLTGTTPQGETVTALVMPYRLPK